MEYKTIIKSKSFYMAIAMFICTMALLYCSRNAMNESSRLVDEVQYVDSVNNYHKIHYSKAFEDLEKENKRLYDSLQSYKKQINHLLQFTYEKEYESGKVVTNNANTIDSVRSKTFVYTSEPSDTFEYKLKINADKEPYWYSLNAKVKEKFTIVNKQSEDGELNHLTIESQGKGNISDVTAFEAKRKKSFKQRFSIGPSITAGYDPLNNRFGLVVGVGVSYDLFK